MASNEKQTFPNLPVKHWWVLRNRFKQSIPSAVTAGFLATSLGMQERSAKANILPALIAFKIIDEDGKPTERAVQWRDDQQYPKVCADIKQEIYPQELIEALPGSSPDREAVERWFANKTGVGVVAARKMALVYLVLCEADPSQGQDIISAPSKTKEKTKPKRPVNNTTKVEKPEATSKPLENLPNVNPTDVKLNMISPSLHIDIQIHISSDASTDQIDQIFASMAKHLYKNPH